MARRKALASPTATIPDPNPDSDPAVTAQARYDELVSYRAVYEDRAIDAARLTIPGIFPPRGSTAGSKLPSPYQSVGARGVNNIAAKLLLALLPPGSSFFRLEAATKLLDTLKAQAGDQVDVEGEVQAALSKTERAIQTALDASNIRPVLFQTFLHLVVAGNGLIQILADLRFKLFPLSTYVVKRDIDGNVLEIVTKEMLSRSTLPEAALKIAQAAPNASHADQSSAKTVALYTRVLTQPNGSITTFQEIYGQTIPGSEGKYPAGKGAWLPLRWSEIPGEDYGRGMVEENIGDLLSLDSLSQSIVEGASGMAKILFLRDPAGTTERQSLQDARNLEIIDGNARDITVLQVEKAADFSVARAQSQEIQSRLTQAFLLASSIQRDAERVTAEEIRLLATELEQSLGGVYSTFSQELQRPLIDRVIAVLQKQGALPQYSTKSVTPSIITGLEGLGRVSDLGKLDSLVQGLAQTFGPQAVAQYINVGAYLVRRAGALSLDIPGLVKTDEQVQQEQQQAAQQQLATKLGPHAIAANAQRDVAAQKGAAQAAPTSSPTS